MSVSRKIRKNYCCLTSLPIIPEDNSHINSINKIIKVNGKEYLTNCVDFFVKSGDEVFNNEIKVKEYGVATYDQNLVSVYFFISSDSSLRYFVEDKLIPLGEIKIDLKNSKGLDRKIIVSMEFGKEKINFYII